MDSMLIDFWGRHACLFNSSDVSFNDRELKTRLWSEFAASIGKSGEPVIMCEAVSCHEAVGSAPGSAFDWIDVNLRICSVHCGSYTSGVYLKCWFSGFFLSSIILFLPY